MALEDETKIMDEIEAFNQAWNRGDAQTAASFFTEDETRVGVSEWQATYKRGGLKSKVPFEPCSGSDSQEPK